MAVGFLMSQRAGANLQMALADGGAVEVFIGGPSGSGIGQGVLLFPNIAAMSAFDMTGIVSTDTGEGKGTIAFTQLNTNAYWSFDPLDTTTANGITIANANIPATPGVGRWRRYASGNVAEAQKQTAWFFDFMNTSGTASDENDGLTAQTALLTKAEQFRRWGYTWSPDLDGVNVVNTYLSSEIPGGEGGGGHDPGPYAPRFLSGATLVHVAPLPAPSFTGTINNITAKNPAAGTALSIRVATVTGSLDQDLFVINTTRGSCAFVYANPGGEAAITMTQPKTNTAGDTSTLIPTTTEDNGWAISDALMAYLLIQVDLPTIGGQTIGVPQEGSASHILRHINNIDSTLNGSPAPFIAQASANIVIEEARTRRTFSPQGIGAGIQAINISNFNIAGSIVQGQPAGVAPATLVSAGCVRAPCVWSATVLQDDIIIGSTGAYQDCDFGNVYLDNATMNCFGQCVCSGAIYANKGTVNVDGGYVDYQGDTAVNRFGGLIAPTDGAAGQLLLLSQAHGYSNATTAGVVAVHQLTTITPAELDAAAGATGYGGVAYLPAGVAFTSGATP